MAFWKRFECRFERPKPDVGAILERSLPAPLRFPQFYVTQSMRIQGDLESDAHGHVEGTVDGGISLGDRSLTIGRNGRVLGPVRAATVLVRGRLVGDVFATESVEIAPGGSVEGKIVSPRFVLAEGAEFKGSVNPGGAARRRNAGGVTMYAIQGPAGGSTQRPAAGEPLAPRP
jgi:cytoskeletal protein CcmA (bactofilin family)